MGGKKGENTKKVAGNAKKAENEAKKQAAAAEQRERDESSQWATGARDGSKKQAAADKKAEQAAKKLEAKQLLEAEEASQPAKAKGANKKTAEKKTRGTLDLSALDEGTDNKKQSALNATGIDNALDALSLTAASNEVQIDRHPERRREAAYQAFAAWREDELKQEEPGLRSSQRAQRMRKEFEKRPENPMNQVNAGHYAASKTEMTAQRDQIRSATEDRLAQPNRKF